MCLFMILLTDQHFLSNSLILSSRLTWLRKHKWIGLTRNEVIKSFLNHHLKCFAISNVIFINNESPCISPLGHSYFMKDLTMTMTARWQLCHLLKFNNKSKSLKYYSIAMSHCGLFWEKYMQEIMTSSTVITITNLAEALCLKKKRLLAGINSKDLELVLIMMDSKR